MKRIALFFVGCLAACVSQPDATSTQPESDDLTAVAAPLITTPEATDSVWWNQKNDADDLWPTNQGITSVTVLYRKAADSSAGPTFQAFVVWNGNHVGRIYRVHVGADGTSFHNAVQSLLPQRTFGHPGTDSTSGGNPTIGSGKPTPHPNVDGQIHYTPDYITNVRTNAAQIHAAYLDFYNFDPVATPTGISAE